MFGGVGIFSDDGRMFAVLVAGRIYLKTAASSIPLFEDAGSEPFIHVAKGVPRRTSYWSLPEEARRSGEALDRWTQLALAAAREAASAKLRPRGSSYPARPR